MWHHHCGLRHQCQWISDLYFKGLAFMFVNPTIHSVCYENEKFSSASMLYFQNPALFFFSSWTFPWLLLSPESLKTANWLNLPFIFSSLSLSLSLSLTHTLTNKNFLTFTTSHSFLQSPSLSVSFSFTHFLNPFLSNYLIFYSNFLNLSPLLFHSFFQCNSIHFLNSHYLSYSSYLSHMRYRFIN